jgi:chorismate mutase
MRRLFGNPRQLILSTLTISLASQLVLPMTAQAARDREVSAPALRAKETRDAARDAARSSGIANELFTAVKEAKLISRKLDLATELTGNLTIEQRARINLLMIDSDEVRESVDKIIKFLETNKSQETLSAMRILIDGFTLFPLKTKATSAVEASILRSWIHHLNELTNKITSDKSLITRGALTINGSETAAITAIADVAEIIRRNQKFDSSSVVKIAAKQPDLKALVEQFGAPFIYQALKAHKTIISEIKPSADGQIVTTHSADGLTIIWQFDSRTERFRTYTGDLNPRPR